MTDDLRPSGTGCTFFALSLFFALVGSALFAARTLTVWKYTQKPHLDYWLALLTFVSIAQLHDLPPLMLRKIIVTASNVFGDISFFYGIGNHADNLDEERAAAALLLVWICMLTGLVAIVFGKLALIAFLDQIRGHQHRRPWFLWFIGVSNIVVHSIVVALILNQCEPHAKLWNQSLPGVCDSRNINRDFAYFQGSKLTSHPYTHPRIRHVVVAAN